MLRRSPPNWVTLGRRWRELWCRYTRAAASTAAARTHVHVAERDGVRSRIRASPTLHQIMKAGLCYVAKRPSKLSDPSPTIAGAAMMVPSRCGQHACLCASTCTNTTVIATGRSVSFDHGRGRRQSFGAWCERVLQVRWSYVDAYGNGAVRSGSPQSTCRSHTLQHQHRVAPRRSPAATISPRRCVIL